MATVQLFSIGNALVDHEFLVDDAFLAQENLSKGTMQLCDADQQARLIKQLAEFGTHKKQASGGSAANTTVAFSALGGAGFYACRVGNDELASFYLNDLEQSQVATHRKSISEGQTGTCLVLITPDSERTMYTYLGITAELSDDQVDFTALANAKWLYIEGYLATSETAQQAVAKARRIARENGVSIAISLSDPAMVQYAKSGLDALIADGVDLLFCNEQEALMYTQLDDLHTAAHALLKLSKTVVITLGSAGALVCTQTDQPKQIQGEKAIAIDTNGAGDAFAGAFLFALVQNHSLEQATHLGHKVAAQVVSQYGPRLQYEQYQALLK